MRFLSKQIDNRFCYDYEDSRYKVLIDGTLIYINDHFDNMFMFIYYSLVNKYGVLTELGCMRISPRSLDVNYINLNVIFFFGMTLDYVYVLVCYIITW